MKNTQITQHSLYEMRQLSGVSTTQIEDMCDIKYRTLRNWETGATIPNIVNIIKLLTIYGFSIEQLDISLYIDMSGKQIVKHKQKVHEMIHLATEQYNLNT